MASAQVRKFIARHQRPLKAAAIAALLICGWLAGIRAPAHNAEALLLARGPAGGAAVYEGDAEHFGPDEKHAHAPWASLMPEDLVIAHIPTQFTGPARQLHLQGEWARLWAVGLPPNLPRLEVASTMAARVADLVPVRLDSIIEAPANDKGLHARLEPSFAGWRYDITQYDTALGPVISLIDSQGGEHSLYRLNEDNIVHWMFCGAYGGTLYMLLPAMRVVSQCRGADGVPDILAFQPPLGLVCWRWQGKRFAVALPRLREIPLLLAFLLHGYLWWLSVLIALAPVYLLGLRHIMPWRQALALVSWWGILIGLDLVTPRFLQTTFLSIMAAPLIAILVWVVATHRPRTISVVRLGLSVGLWLICSVALVFWLMFIEGYIKFYGMSLAP